MITLSQNLECKKCFDREEIIHSLIKSTLAEPDENGNSVEAMQILCHASSINHIEYPPCSSMLKASNKLFQEKIMQWGGLIAIFYINKNAKSKSMKEMCQEINIEEFFKENKLERMANTIKEYLDNSSSTLPKVQNKDRSASFPKYYLNNV